jgi:ribosomal protein L11 methylase PrmA
VVNHGCAEGFYGIGMALRTNPSLVTFIDIDQRALDIAKKNVAVNLNPQMNVNYLRECTHDDLNNELTSGRPFLFMDCEGYEDELLVIEKIPNLVHTRILVESHDCIRAGLTMRLIERFRQTHTIILIGQGAKNPYMDITADMSDAEKMLLTCEFRPSTMYWLYMVPKE